MPRSEHFCLNVLSLALKCIFHSVILNCVCFPNISGRHPSSRWTITARTFFSLGRSWGSWRLSILRLGSRWIWSKGFLWELFLRFIFNFYLWKAHPHRVFNIQCSQMTTHQKVNYTSCPLVSQGSCNWAYQQ